MTAGRGTSIDGVVGGPARHIAVLIDEVMAYLAPGAGGIFIDGTFGAGGYTKRILDTGASVLAIDRDRQAIAVGRPLEAAAGGRLTLVEGRFSDLDRLAAEHGHETVDGVVLDIGVSSMQLDEASRGFSFRLGGPLDMRMGAEGPTAGDVVNRMEPRRPRPGDRGARRGTESAGGGGRHRQGAVGAGDRRDGRACRHRCRRGRPARGR